MTWQSIRLELEATRDFPKGSASRAYILRLPLTASGAIDAEALTRAPQQATVRRLWPSEPDLSGHAVQVDGHLAFYARQDSGGGIFSTLNMPVLREGASITVSERGGEPLPFRVARLSASR
ncbi:hypothetical protein M8312_09555 [Sphingomonas sp. KRR8]|uniref:hypothetical protein n=1 Tax=Sphingomonas sp. KRR8 TaxID=2942996 RepID=UPI00201FE91D|nr:hypothetical protein [Sphingomonas sp. KRR8]URD60044.1 hypothetical protein M8312_09555 [Sphingomonas sp. KRR8]